uniref:cytoplasmic protein NCK1-like isoform X1 n=1 Tax=Styela clava TaxID=7725 RepID=UPI001939628E|nr:cytoplasmic protein NCK1-like isoform X1 [Styela clava]
MLLGGFICLCGYDCQTDMATMSLMDAPCKIILGVSRLPSCHLAAAHCTLAGRRKIPLEKRTADCRLRNSRRYKHHRRKAKANRFPGTRKGKGGGAAPTGSSVPSSRPPLGLNSTNNSEGDGIRKFSNTAVHDRTMDETYVAKYNYSSTRQDELSLIKGMSVIVISKENDGWWQGKNTDGDVGWFPSNYVEESMEPSGGDMHNNHVSGNTVVSAAKPVLEVARALYPFNSGNDEELPFEAGDMFDIISKPESDPEWYEARNAEGRTGLVPRNYIEAVPGAPSVFLPEVTNYDDVSQDLSSGNSPSVNAGNGDGSYNMSAKPWYFGSVRRAVAESMLHRAGNSEFIVRDSESTVGDLSVSMKAPDRIKHFKVSLRSGKYCIGQRKFDSVDELIEHYRKAPIYTAPDIGKIYLGQPLPR